MNGSQWSRGWKFLIHALAAFKNYPFLVLPILIVWLVYVPSVLYIKFYFRSSHHTTGASVVVVFFFLGFFSLMILLACDLLLHLVKQMEEDGNASLMRAASATFREDLIRLLPLAMAWTFIWFALTLLEALLSRNNDDASGDPELDAQSAAEAIAGFDGSFSLNRAFFEAMKKGVRMVVFLILPAIAWDGMTAAEAIERGLNVLKAHTGEFARSFALTYAAAMVVFLPACIVFLVGAPHRHAPALVNFPPWVWLATIVYCGFAWSFCIYLEQMSVAQLYLWHAKWETKFMVAKADKRPLPAFKDIEPPALLARVPVFSA